MRTNEILTTIPDAQHSASIHSDPDVALEIALDEQEDGQATIALRRLTWGNGLGWCRQQALTLTTDEADALIRALQKSQRKWKGEPATSSGNVIPFPR